MDNNNQVMPAPSQRLSDEMRLAGANYYNPVVWQGMIKFAKTLIDAKACPAGLDTEAKVLVALQAGREVGLSPINALNSFYIVNGKITIYGDSAIALVLRDGHQIDWGKCDATEANVTITRFDNKKTMTAKFTYADAQRKKLDVYSDGRKNPFWQKFPENMLKFKAFGSIARFIVADSLRGMSIKEELDGSSIDVTADVAPSQPSKAISGEVINNAPTAPAPTETANLEEEKDESASLQEFINKEPEKPAEPIKKRQKADIIKDINSLCLESGKNPKKVLEHYKKNAWTDFTVENLLKIEESVKLSIKPNDTEEKIKDLKARIAEEEMQLQIAEENPTETTQFYSALNKQRARLQDIKNELSALEPKAPTPAQPEAPKEQEEDLATYYMPEEDVLAIVNDLLAKDPADLNEVEMNLANDVSDDKFLGKAHPRYKGLFR